MTRYARLKTELDLLPWFVKVIVIPAGTIVEITHQYADESLVCINGFYNIICGNDNLEFLDE